MFVLNGRAFPLLSCECMCKCWKEMQCLNTAYISSMYLRAKIKNHKRKISFWFCYFERPEKDGDREWDSDITINFIYFSCSFSKRLFFIISFLVAVCVCVCVVFYCFFFGISLLNFFSVVVVKSSVVAWANSLNLI